MTVKMAVLAPMAKASVMKATADTPRFFLSSLAANRNSRNQSAIVPSRVGVDSGRAAGDAGVCAAKGLGVRVPAFGPVAPSSGGIPVEELTGRPYGRLHDCGARVNYRDAALCTRGGVR